MRHQLPHRESAASQRNLWRYFIRLFPLEQTTRGSSAPWYTLYCCMLYTVHVDCGTGITPLSFMLKCYEFCVELSKYECLVKFIIEKLVATRSHSRWLCQFCNIFDGERHQGIYSLSGKTSYGKISWSLEAARFGFRLFQSLKRKQTSKLDWRQGSL